MVVEGTKEELVEGFRVQSILEAALRVIASRGPAGATMQGIADEAGIAKGTIYLYFKSREELLEKAAEASFTELLGRLEAALAEPGTLRERLREVLRTKIEFFDDRQEFLRVYISMRNPEGACAADDRQRRANRPQYHRYLEQLTRFLAGAMASGEARSMDPSRVALVVAEGTSAILLRRLSESPPPSCEEEVDWLADLLLGGLAAPGAAS